MRTFRSAEERQEINEQSMRADESEGIQWLRNKSYRQVRRILSARETSDRFVQRPRLADPERKNMGNIPVEHFSCYGWSGARWARSHSVGEVPRRWVKTRVRAVPLVYPTAVAMSLSELPLRSMVWAMPRRQLVR